MSDPHVITALTRKRAEISGEIRELNARIHDLRRDQGHIDAAMKLFDPEAQPRLIKPVRPWKPGNRIFERKELSIRVMNALREAGDAGTTLEAIVEPIMDTKKLEPAAAPMIRRVTTLVLAGLKRHGIATVNSETPPRWTVV